MKKSFIVLLALVLIVGIAVGGTVAWLTASTTEVKNTFTTADIGLTLTETFNAKSDDSKQENDIWKAQMIPGYSYKKDPKVTVSNDSVDCYLFVKFEETNNPSTYLTYTSTLTAANGWTQGDGTDIPANVWYRVVKTTDETKSWNLLAGDTTYANGVITVKDTVTKDNMTTAASATLTYTAYASQLYKSAGVEFSAKEAWNNVPKS